MVTDSPLFTADDLLGARTLEDLVKIAKARGVPLQKPSSPRELRGSARSASGSARESPAMDRGEND